MPDKDICALGAVHDEQIRETSRQVADLACAVKPIAALIERHDERLNSLDGAVGRAHGRINVLWGLFGTILGGAVVSLGIYTLTH